MMGRRGFLLTSLVSALPGLSEGWAQQTTTMPSIAMIFGGTAEMVAHIAAAFERRLGELGYATGRNIRIGYRYTDGTPATVSAVTSDLLGSNVDILLTWGTVGGVAARKANATIPVIFLSVADPVVVGLVSALAHPGGNMTGVTSEASLETKPSGFSCSRRLFPRYRGLLCCTSRAMPT